MQQVNGDNSVTLDSLPGYCGDVLRYAAEKQVRNYWLAGLVSVIPLLLITLQTGIPVGASFAISGAAAAVISYAANKYESAKIRRDLLHNSGVACLLAQAGGASIEKLPCICGMVNADFARGFSQAGEFYLASRWVVCGSLIVRRENLRGLYFYRVNVGVGRYRQEYWEIALLTSGGFILRDRKSSSAGQIKVYRQLTNCLPHLPAMQSHATDRYLFDRSNSQVMQAMDAHLRSLRSTTKYPEL